MKCELLFPQTERQMECPLIGPFIGILSVNKNHRHKHNLLPTHSM